MDLEFLRVLAGCMKEAQFYHAAAVRSVFTQIRSEELMSWPIFSYLQKSGYKAEIGTLLFELIRFHKEACPDVQLKDLIPNEKVLTRYQQWEGLALILQDNGASRSSHEPVGLQAVSDSDSTFTLGRG